jgi:outer membrane immunogenic protein
MHWRGLLIPAMATVAATYATESFAQVDIGRAASVQNRVEGTIRGSRRLIETQDSVFQNERLRTDESGQAQLVFIDYTKFDIGPKSEATLNRFIYNPDRGTGRVRIEARRGVYRFETGRQDPTHYEVDTHIATLEPRGTEFHLLVERDYIVVALVHGALRIVTVRGPVILLDQPGTTVTIYANGKVEGPMRWTGSFTRYAGYVPFPNFISNFAGSSPCYVGMTGGYITSGHRTTSIVANDADLALSQTLGNVPTSLSGAPAGGTVGGLIGCNYQTGNLVFGAESDLSYTSLNETDAVTLGAFAVTTTYHQEMRALGTVRGRIGYAFGPTLLYAAAGLAYGDLKEFASIIPGPAGVLLGGTQLAGARDQWRVGWTVGAGIEHLISPNWSIRGEYLYFDLGNSSLPVTTIAGAPIESGSFNRHNDGHIIRAGINYHFGGPLIAKY